LNARLVRAFVVVRFAGMELRDGDLVLRPWTEGDVPALVAALNDPEIPRWIPVIPRPYTEADALAYVRGEVHDLANTWAFTVDGRPIGSIGMGTNQYAVGHIGYWCAREARGQGFTPRALRLVCRYAFEELGLGRLELVTDPDNVASQRVAEKVGFRREGVLRSHLLHPDGRRRDSIMFSLLPGELAE
jgi:RimJ/RimL family protein N-acetyltransferase